MAEHANVWPRCHWCSEPIGLVTRSACCPDVCHPCVVAGSHGDACANYEPPEPDYNAPNAAERLEMTHRGKR